MNCANDIVTTVSNYGTYNLVVVAQDKASNLNIQNESFATSAAVATAPLGGSSNTQTAPVVIIGKNATWSMETSTGGKKYDFVMSIGGSRTSRVIFRNLEAENLTVNITCENVGRFDICQYLTFIRPDTSFFEQTAFAIDPEDVVVHNGAAQITLPATEHVNAYIGFNLKLPANITDNVYNFNIRGVAQSDKSTGIISVQARVGKYNAWSWLVSKVIGKTIIDLSWFGEEFRQTQIYNFFLLMIPYIFLSPILFFGFFQNNKIKLPLSIGIPFIVSFLLMFFIG